MWLLVKSYLQPVDFAIDFFIGYGWRIIFVARVEGISLVVVAQGDNSHNIEVGLGLPLEVGGKSLCFAAIGITPAISG